MNRLIKTILISSIAIFGTGFLLAPSVFANNNLVVQFEQTPLFNEANFLPGENIARWVKVTNNSNQTQRIATEAINKNDPNRLGDVLNLEIKEGGITRYNDSLSKFFATGETFLSNLAGNGTQTQYDFIVTFYSGTQNSFQGKNLSFDILIGFQGTEGGLLPGAGGGGGGFLPPGLTIPDESVRITNTAETNVTITWTTSYQSTSQVIYAKEGESHTLDLTDSSGAPPKYGYAHTTPEYDVSPKVTAHTVTIIGLTPNTTYYYRAVSHASLAVSREYSFTTLEAGKIGGEKIVSPAGEIVLAPTELAPTEKGETEKTPEKIAGLEEIQEITKAEKSFGDTLAEKGLLAAIGTIPLNLKIILMIIGIIILGLIILWLIKKRKTKPR